MPDFKKIDPGIVKAAFGTSYKVKEIQTRFEYLKSAKLKILGTVKPDLSEAKGQPSGAEEQLSDTSKLGNGLTGKYILLDPRFFAELEAESMWASCHLL